MAEIAIKSVVIGRTNPQDFGSPTGGSRVYMARYALPGIAGMEDQTHIIPMAALVNHRLDTGETDPVVSMQAMLQDYMAMNLTVAEMGQREAQINPDSYLVQSAIAVQTLHAQLDEHSQQMAASVPMADIADAHDAVQEAFITNATPARLAKMTKNVSVFKNTVGKLQAVRGEYTGVVTPLHEEHPVDTSVKPWATLAQAIADDTDEFAVEQDAWFGHRFGRQVKFIAGKRMVEAGRAVKI